jgi:hypothetical protein
MTGLEKQGMNGDELKPEPEEERPDLEEEGKQDAPIPADLQAWQPVQPPAEPPPFTRPPRPLLLRPTETAAALPVPPRSKAPFLSIPLQLRAILTRLFAQLDKPQESRQASYLDTIRREMREDAPVELDPLPDWIAEEIHHFPFSDHDERKAKRRRWAIEKQVSRGIKDLVNILPPLGVPFGATIEDAIAGNTEAREMVLATLVVYDELATSQYGMNPWLFLVPDADLLRQFCSNDIPLDAELRPVVLALAADMRFRFDPKKYPLPSKFQLLKSSFYCVHTGQEFTALTQSAAHGKYGTNYNNDDQALERTHATPGSPFLTRFKVLDEEQEIGGLELVNGLTDRMDADGALALMYVSNCLAPPAPLPPNAYAGGWVDLDDVAKKIGLTQPRDAVESEANRRKVWDYLRFGARAEVVGRRTKIFKDSSGKEISTEISTALWSVVSKQRPIQPALADCDTVPVRVELVMSQEWANLITAAKTCQYIPLGEVIGAIPGGKPGGAWARVIGLTFMSLCRRKPVEMLAGTIQLTREELLSTIPAKLAPYRAVLDGTNPKRAITYWNSAMGLLVDAGVLAREGEAGNSNAGKLGRNRQQLPSRNWQEEWLKTPVLLVPGAKLEGPVQECAGNLPPARIRSLTAPKRRGRPRKQHREEDESAGNSD